MFLNGKQMDVPVLYSIFFVEFRIYRGLKDDLGVLERG
jgi:hypothetical protein